MMLHHPVVSCNLPRMSFPHGFSSAVVIGPYGATVWQPWLLSHQGLRG